MAAARLVALALALALLLAAAPAAHAADVSHDGVDAVAMDGINDDDANTGLLTIVDNNDDAEVIVVTQTASGGVEVRRDGGGLTTSDAPDCADTNGDGSLITCAVPVTSIGANLAGGVDVFTARVSVTVGVAGGDQNDILTIRGAGNDVLAGGAGNDALDGGGGTDDYFGETGNDTIEARDGLPERISCGADDDQARNDFTDIIAECERGVDADGDGYNAAIDCNDAASSVNPGAQDAVGNGVDEDCDGQDDRNLDRDGDGFPIPADCDDSDAKVRPNAREVRGNETDENCDRRAQPYATLPSLISANWRLARSYTRLRALIVRNAPKGARIALSCKGDGCPFRGTRRATVPRDLAPVALQRPFRRARLRSGARVVVRITARGTIGRTFTYTMQPRALPETRVVCRAPGAKKGTRC
jgi:hypothetical protein